MISGFAVNQVYLATGVTDMRKSINGLSLMVSEQLVHDPFSGSVFVFCNRALERTATYRLITMPPSATLSRS